MRCAVKRVTRRWNCCKAMSQESSEIQYSGWWDWFRHHGVADNAVSPFYVLLTNGGESDTCAFLFYRNGIYMCFRNRKSVIKMKKQSC